jgi:imidazole glycerol-phosphate synthase subunit HisF
MPLRVIPRLDIKGPNLVKGIHLEGLRVLGKPEVYAKHYYDEGADELVYMDAVASLLGRNSLLDIVERTAQKVFIPLCVGGGIRTKDDIRKALRAGADKVSINTAALADPDFVAEAARDFGSSTIVVTIETIRQEDGTHLCFTNCGRERTDVEAVTWAQRAESLGAGEIMVTSVDREGTGRGFDVELVRQVADSVSIPVIAHGGAGISSDVVNVVERGRADAVAVASLLHYRTVRNLPYDPADYAGEGNTEFLLHRRHSGFGRIKDCSLKQIKGDLVSAGLAPSVHSAA